MTITVDAGALLINGDLVEVAAQTSAAIVPPASNSRVDRITLDRTTGKITILTGVEATNPIPPAISPTQSPLDQIGLVPGMGAITNVAIKDERLSIPSSGSGLIGVQTFAASGTYVAAASTSRVIVRIVGGGGSGGSCENTSSDQVACASGGGAGAYAEALLTSGFDGVPIIVGNGGAPAAAGNYSGNPGGATSFGTVVAPGGTAGYGSAAQTPPLLWGGTGISALPTAANLVASAGAEGGVGFALSTSIVIGGTGGSSVFGGGGPGAGFGAGEPGQAPGAGGGGASAIANRSAAQGGAGANGIVIIYEFC